MIRLPDVRDEARAADPLRVGILGCGNVGAEVARRLLEREDVRLTRVLVRDVHRPRPVGRALLTRSIDEVFESRPDAIIELLGGVEPARCHVEAAVRRGVHVVTANKSLLARHGEALHDIAARCGARLLCEASVGAGTPILAALDQLRGDRVTAIRGVVNGTCNFILTRMEATGCALGDALREAQQLGYAEPDPTADLTGRDSAEKLCVLAQRAGWGWVHPDSVNLQGITTITAEDVRSARRQRCVIRLIAEAERHADGAASLRVGPCFVPVAHCLASVTGCGNAFEIEAQLAGRIHLQGPGAGPRCTASAILGDLISLTAATTPHTSRRRAALNPPGAVRRHYIRADTAPERLEPGALLDSLNQSSIRFDSLDLQPACAVISTMPVSFDEALILAESLAGGKGDRCLVAPVLE